MRMVMSPHSVSLSPGAARTPCSRLHIAPRLCMIRSYISKIEIEGSYSCASTFAPGAALATDAPSWWAHHRPCR
jgi:hypothetical protein